jgi:hypothetical protein
MPDCIIRFTGLCALVPNKPLDQTPERMCAVLVDGRNLLGATKALDGTVLRRHRGFIRFDLRNLPTDYKGNEEHHGVWYLERKRIVIRDDTKALDTTSYIPGIDTNFDISATSTADETSFSWVAALTKLMPAFAAIDPACVSTNIASVPATVLSQVFFNTGKLTVEKPTPQVWSVSGALSTQFARQPFAHEVVLTLTGVTQLTLEAKDLAGGADDKLELVPGSLGKIEITIANLCDDNPLRWPHDPSPQDDDDFKWYYQLMTTAQHASINKQRRGAPLPTPIPERKKVSPNVTGVNCFSVRVADTPFNMP